MEKPMTVGKKKKRAWKEGEKRHRNLKEVRTVCKTTFRSQAAIRSSAEEACHRIHKVDEGVGRNEGLKKRKEQRWSERREIFSLMKELTGQASAQKVKENTEEKKTSREWKEG